MIFWLIFESEDEIWVKAGIENLTGIRVHT